MRKTGTYSIVQALHRLDHNYVCHGYDNLDPSNYALWVSAVIVVQELAAIAELFYSVYFGVMNRKR